MKWLTARERASEEGQVSSPARSCRTAPVLVRGSPHNNTTEILRGEQSSLVNELLRSSVLLDVERAAHLVAVLDIKVDLCERTAVSENLGTIFG